MEHQFEVASISSPKRCAVCRALILRVKGNSLFCPNCGSFVHMSCMKDSDCLLCQQAEGDEDKDQFEEEVGSETEFEEEEDDDDTPKQSIADNVPANVPLARLKVQFLETLQLGTEGKQRVWRTWDILGFTASCGKNQVFHSPRVQALMEEQHALAAEEVISKKISRLHAIQNRLPKVANIDFGNPYIFDIFSPRDEICFTFFKPKAVSMGLIKAPVGQLIIPFLQALESFEAWFEVFPSFSRPAIPLVSRTGMDFPAKAIGFVKVHVDVQLLVPRSEIYHIFLRNFLSSQPEEMVIKRKKSRVRDLPATTRQIRRNAIRVEVSRAYIRENFSLTFLELIRSWEEPVHSILFLILWSYIVMIASAWQTPLLAFVLLQAFSRIHLSKKPLGLNWKTMPIKPEETPKRNNRVEMVKQGWKSGFIARRLGKKIEEEALDNEDSVVANPATSRIENEMFWRENSGDQFLLWNHEIRDPNKALNLFQKTTKVANEIGWLQDMLQGLADFLEKCIHCLNAEDELVTTTFLRFIGCVLACLSFVLFVFSLAPFFWRSIFLAVTIAAVMPPRWRVFEVKNGSVFISYPFRYISALWIMIPTTDDTGKRFIASKQKVTKKEE